MTSCKLAFATRKAAQTVRSKHAPLCYFPPDAWVSRECTKLAASALHLVFRMRVGVGLNWRAFRSIDETCQHVKSSERENEVLYFFPTWTIYWMSYSGLSIAHEHEFSVGWDEGDGLFGWVFVQFYTLVELTIVDGNSSDGLWSSKFKNLKTKTKNSLVWLLP